MGLTPFARTWLKCLRLPWYKTLKETVTNGGGGGGGRGLNKLDLDLYVGLRLIMGDTRQNITVEVAV